MTKTYGTVDYDADARTFAIRVEPHVAIRLRRVFARAGRSVRDVYELAATPENAYELRWFAQRYPLEFRCEAELERAARAFEDRRLAVAGLGQTVAGHQAQLFNTLAVQLRDYQLAATDLALKSGSLLIADDVGLGKTATAIGMFVDPATLPALVVTLTHLPLQWEAEIKKFAPHLSTYRLRDGKARDLTTLRGRRGRFPDVIVSNYYRLRGWRGYLRDKVRTVIFDEIQELRTGSGNEKNDAALAIAEACNWRVGLSATPIYNYGTELWSVLNALAPGALGTRSEFCLEWCRGSEDKDASVENPKALGAYLREGGYMIRRTRAEVGRELPSLEISPQYIELSNVDQMTGVGKNVVDLCQAILGGQITDQLERLKMGNELDWRLRQATGIAKAPWVADFVRLLVQSGEPVVLFGWHHEVYSIWLDKLADLNPVMYTGAQTEAEKAEARKRFLDGDAKVMIMSLRAGAGVDGLQMRTRVVVVGELDWSPGVHEQGIGRVHRDGQKQSTIAYYMIADDGSDPIIADVLGLKAGQIAGLRGEDTLSMTGGSATTGAERVRKLAAAWLARHGGGAAHTELLDVPAPAPPDTPIVPEEAPAPTRTSAAKRAVKRVVG